MSDLPSNLPVVEPGDSDAGEGTRAVHTPRPDFSGVRALGLPTYRTSTYAFDTSQQYADVLGDRAAGYTYSRIDNPTVDAFALGFAALEAYGSDRPVAAQAFASGMAAISTVVLALCRAGAHVIAPAAVYGGTYGVLDHVLRRFGVDVSFVDVTDADAVRTAMREETALVWAETIANPTTAVADIEGLAGICHDAGIPLCIDSTFAPPPVCRPLQWGADLVAHSATKYIGGHSDVTGGVVVGDVDLLAAVRKTRIDLGGSLAPDEAFLLHRGLATLPLRVARHCATAARVAEAMCDHPAVERVDYPGLAAHPQHALAGKLFEAGPEGTRYGAVVTITPRGGREAGFRLADRLKVGQVATSLGGTHTIVSHVASTTHRQLDDAALAAAGIAPAAVRFSIGLEDPEDLIQDLQQALA
ncbi:MAG TPA: aminotransferase class I/II-fold pyridoxal phosphate-dependent enzyme [Mycobacteriales bacterium]|jgi:O-acetylhomoserine/O-acetylserine sulfhydrylase-like pyridoxal-dependent enzyme|nr:aminotransferase class I/II-fold pyridoxal phosphate-dependent enzyme [Mycobacteriales bacterium]